MGAVRRMENRVRVETPTGGWATTAATCVVCGEPTHARDRDGLAIHPECLAGELSTFIDGSNTQLLVRSEGWQL